MSEHARPILSDLFTDPRHYRGDCRLIVRAARSGWLDTVDPAQLGRLQQRCFALNSTADRAGDTRLLISTAWARLALDTHFLRLIDRGEQGGDTLTQSPRIVAAEQG